MNVTEFEPANFSRVENGNSCIMFLTDRIFLTEASRGAGAQSVPVNRPIVGSIPTRGDEIFIYIYIFISSLWCRGESASLSFATHHAMPPEIGGKWGTECLNTRFPLG